MRRRRPAFTRANCRRVELAASATLLPAAGVPILLQSGPIRSSPRPARSPRPRGRDAVGRLHGRGPRRAAVDHRRRGAEGGAAARRALRGPRSLDFGDDRPRASRKAGSDARLQFYLPVPTVRRSWPASEVVPLDRGAAQRRHGRAPTRSPTAPSGRLAELAEETFIGRSRPPSRGRGATSGACTEPARRGARPRVHPRAAGQTLEEWLPPDRAGRGDRHRPDADKPPAHLRGRGSDSCRSSRRARRRSRSSAGAMRPVRSSTLARGCGRQCQLTRAGRAYQVRTRAIK